MSELSAEEIAQLLRPYVAAPIGIEVAEKVSRYLDVFALWSPRISLSTIKAPSDVVRRHFGEGLSLAEALPSFSTLLDLGSGAGFPGLPIALQRQATGIMLAESQQKKASFLKEAAWAMGLPLAVWAGRAENLAKERSFDVVTLRAVDDMSSALATAAGLLRPGGTLAFFVGERETMELPQGTWINVRKVPIACSLGHAVLAQHAR